MHLHSHPVHWMQGLQFLEWEGEQQAEPPQAWDSPFFVERSQLPSTMDDLGLSQSVRVVRNLPANAGDIRQQVQSLGWEDSPGGGHGNLLQYSVLEKPMDRGTWWAEAHGVTNSRTWLSY